MKTFFNILARSILESGDNIWNFHIILSNTYLSTDMSFNCYKFESIATKFGVGLLPMLNNMLLQ